MYEMAENENRTLKNWLNDLKKIGNMIIFPHGC